MTRVVVTGDAGALASLLCERLPADGCTVIALDDPSTGTPGNVEHLLEHERFRLVDCDVTDYVHVPGPVDGVLHFPGPASPADHLEVPPETLEVGSTGRCTRSVSPAHRVGARHRLRGKGRSVPSGGSPTVCGSRTEA